MSASRRAAVALVTLVGCADAATVGRSDGPDIEARIERSDVGALYVRSSNGQIYRVERASITDVDHPGNVLGWVGLSLLAAGALFVAGSTGADPDSRRVVSAEFAIPGLLMALGGWYHYFRSVNAARTFEQAEVVPMRLPPAQTVPPPSFVPPSSVAPAIAAPPDAASSVLPAWLRPSSSDGGIGTARTVGDAAAPSQR